MTNWFKLITPEAMARIAEVLRRESRAVVIRDVFNKQILVDPSIPATPLEEVIRTDFRTLFSIGPYKFLVKKESMAAALDLMEVYSTPEGDRLKFEFIHPFSEQGETLASADLVRLDSQTTDRALVTLDQGNSLLEVWPADLEGRETGPVSVSGMPLRTGGLRKLRIHVSITGAVQVYGPLMLILRDPEGKPIGYICVAGPSERSPAR